MKAILLTLSGIALITQLAFAQSIKNFTKNGAQVTKFDNLGKAVDAHDGEIALFNGVYYLYGTSYDCGFEWGNKKAPFCGFKVYTSTDMEHWVDKGFLFDAQTTIWQTRCDGKTYGCFRPHVIFNQKTRRYVLWINVYDNRVGYRVFTSKKPAGPFTEVKEPTLAVNSDMPAAGLNNGDHDTFVDDDGTAYLAYTDWRTKGSIVIEKLSADYLTGTGVFVKAVTTGETEAPALFKRKGIYYVVYSDPNCGYCSGTGASYRTARSPLGPWSEGIKISDNSCGGQPSFVSTIKLNSASIFLFGSDLWNNAAKNEALANFYWAPLDFAADGSIKPIVCEQTVSLPKDAARPQQPGNARQPEKDFTTGCDIGKSVQRAQGFTAAKGGMLNKIVFTTFKSGYPDAVLAIELYEAGVSGKPSGKPLAAVNVPPGSLSWAAKNVSVYPHVAVSAGERYIIVIKSATTAGCYGFAYTNISPLPEGSAAVSSDGGINFSTETDRELKLQVFID
ncbi:MAG: family 43 glycosylhydrolase [Mucilaginibacter sp.]